VDRSKTPNHAAVLSMVDKAVEVHRKISLTLPEPVGTTHCVQVSGIERAGGVCVCVCV
jgi:hypothetical protein